MEIHPRTDLPMSTQVSPSSKSQYSSIFRDSLTCRYFQLHWVNKHGFQSIVCHKYWRRQWHPTPVLLSGKSHGRMSLVGCSPWGRKELDTTERLQFPFSLSWIGEGNGNPLVFLPGEYQGRGSLVGYSPGLTKSRIQLSDSHRHIMRILKIRYTF